MKPSEDLIKQYQQARDDVAWFALHGTVIRISGEDRHLFLHNFCTNEIKALQPGHACEAFILNGKGKTIAHVHVLNIGTSLLIHSPAKLASELIEHLDRYIIREDVQLEDCSDLFHAAFVVGADQATIGKLIADAPVNPNELSLDDSDGERVIANIELAGFGCLVLTTCEPTFALPSSDLQVLEMLRVEHRTPWFGSDIDDSNLPQELLRDEIAISFTKGCYLGQETVARIDAIGKVNRVIVAVKLTTGEPRGANLIAGDKIQGQLTSVVWSPQEASFLGLAILRRPHEKSGTVLQCGTGTATVLG